MKLMLPDVIGHDNQSQHNQHHRCLCLDLSGQITTRTDFHTTPDLWSFVSLWVSSLVVPFYSYLLMQSLTKTILNLRRYNICHRAGLGPTSSYSKAAKVLLMSRFSLQ